MNAPASKPGGPTRRPRGVLGAQVPGAQVPGGRVPGGRVLGGRVLVGRVLGVSCAVVLLAAVSGVGSGCVSGHLPTIRTERIDVQDIGAQGLTLAVRLTATNERYSDTIRVDALRVRVQVADQDLGTVDVAESWELPPNQPVRMETTVTVPVVNLPALAMAGASGPVPYHLEGNAHVQNIGWSVGFSYDGHIPQQQLIDAAAPALPFGL